MNRIELNNALDALQDVAGDASDLVPALEAAEKVFDWVATEARAGADPASVLALFSRAIFLEANNEAGNDPEAELASNRAWEAAQAYGWDYEADAWGNPTELECLAIGVQRFSRFAEATRKEREAEAMREAFSEACDREAKFTGRA